MWFTGIYKEGSCHKRAESGLLGIHFFIPLALVLMAKPDDGKPGFTFVY